MSIPSRLRAFARGLFGASAPVTDEPPELPANQDRRETLEPGLIIDPKRSNESFGSAVRLIISAIPTADGPLAAVRSGTIKQGQRDVRHCTFMASVARRLAIGSVT